MIGKAEHSEINASFGVVYSDCFQATLLIAKGDVKAAANLIEHLNHSQFDSGKRPTNVASVVDIMMGVIAYERYDLDASQKLLQFSLPKLEKVGHIHILVNRLSCFS